MKATDFKRYYIKKITIIICKTIYIKNDLKYGLAAWGYLSFQACPFKGNISQELNFLGTNETVVYCFESMFFSVKISENCFKTNAIYKTHLKDNQMHKALLTLLVLSLQEVQSKYKPQICWALLLDHT